MTDLPVKADASDLYEAKASSVLVPTMGALHEGHLQLIRRGRELSDDVVVSIFVNPLQFNSATDLANYPRHLDSDTQKALSAGATTVWSPTFEEIYPGEISKIDSGYLGTIYEGHSRPGHFDGVLTVVNRLFEIAQPRWAIFGEKDFQQLFIVRKWVKDSRLPTEIISVPTIREPSGLAMSSRNVHLSDVGRQKASVIHRALNTGNQADMVKVLESEPAFTLDYAEIIDEETFMPVDPDTKSARAIVAGWIEGIRLIDNAPVRVSS